MEIYFIVLGVMSVIILLAMFIVEVRKAGKISLEERLANRMSVQEGREEKRLSYFEKLELDLERSRVGINVPIYFLIAFVSAGILFAVGMFLIDSIPMSLLVACLGIFVPRQLVNSLKDMRRQEFDEMFSKALKRMSANLRTSATLPQAVMDVATAENLPAVLREEMTKVRVDYEYGLTMEEAFLNLYERTGVEDVKGVAMAIEISTKKGTKLYEAFENYVDSIAERKTAEAEGRAALASTRMTINISAAAPFLFTAMMKIVSPTYFDSIYLLWGGSGKYLFLFLFLLVGAGYIVCKKMCDVKL